MKKKISVLLVAIFMLTFLVGCAKDRLLYKKVNLKNYVEVDDYIGITIDKNSDSFKQYYNAIVANDTEEYGLYVEKQEGVIENGYIANIDYVGKIDGVAFEGGSAEGYNLKIGSNTFIDDFEQELIGVSVGDTKDVTATFPEEYGNNPDLAGKEAIFTVKVNYMGVPMTTEEAYTKMEFNSAKEYEANIVDRAAKDYILNEVCKKSKIKDFPEDDSVIIGDAIYEVYSNDYQNTYGVNLEELLIYNGKTVEDFKKELSTEFMKVSMVMYYILDQEGLEIYESTVEKQEINQSVIAESYAVQDIVLAYLYENAEIK